jgi:hypothetical protein
MKQSLIIILLIFALKANAQEDRTVTLVVSGQGQTLDEARQNALRNAIEQTFGSYISAKTEILNDSLVKDEVVSIINGNIRNYEDVSELLLPNGYYSKTVKAVVSVTNLTKFCENKGIQVEFKGSLFAANRKQQLLNERAEYKTVLNLCDVSWNILSKSLDFEIKVGESPKLIDKENQIYSIGMLVTAKTNQNKYIFYKYFNETLKSLSIPKNEIDLYNSTNVPVYKFYFLRSNDNSDDSEKNRNKNEITNSVSFDTIYMRNEESIVAVKNLLVKSNKYYFDFKIISDIDTFFLGSVQNRYLLGENYYWDHNDYRFNKFFIGINGLLQDKSFSEMGAVVNNIIDIGPINSEYPCDYIESASPLYVCNKILSSETYNPVTTFEKNLWNNELFNLHNFNEDRDVQWFRANSCPFYINLCKQSVFNVFIERTYKLNEIEKINNIKVQPWN